MATFLSCDWFRAELVKTIAAIILLLGYIGYVPYPACSRYGQFYHLPRFKAKVRQLMVHAHGGIQAYIFMVRAMIVKHGAWITVDKITISAHRERIDFRWESDPWPLDFHLLFSPMRRYRPKIYKTSYNPGHNYYHAKITNLTPGERYCFVIFRGNDVNDSVCRTLMHYINTPKYNNLYKWDGETSRFIIS